MMMKNFTKHNWIKAVAVVVLAAFLCADITWAARACEFDIWNLRRQGNYIEGGKLTLPELSPQEVARLSDKEIMRDFRIAMGVKKDEEVYHRLTSRGPNWAIYIGDSEDLPSLIRDDAQTLVELGVSYEEIYSPLRKIRDEFILVPDLMQYRYFKGDLIGDNKPRIITKDGWIIDVDIFMRFSDRFAGGMINVKLGSENSPFTAISPEDYSNINISIYHPEYGIIRFPLLICGARKKKFKGFEPLRFFEGRGTSYRLSPEDMVRVLPGFTEEQKTKAYEIAVRKQKAAIEMFLKEEDWESLEIAIHKLIPMKAEGTDRYLMEIARGIEKKAPDMGDIMKKASNEFKIGEYLRFLQREELRGLEILFKELIPKKPEDKLYSHENYYKINAIYRYMRKNPELKEQALKIMKDAIKLIEEYKSSASSDKLWNFELEKCKDWFKQYIVSLKKGDGKNKHREIKIDKRLEDILQANNLSKAAALHELDQSI